MGIAPETTMVIVMARRLHTIKETITTSNNNNDNSNRQQTTTLMVQLKGWNKRWKTKTKFLYMMMKWLNYIILFLASLSTITDTTFSLFLLFVFYWALFWFFFSSLFFPFCFSFFSLILFITSFFTYSTSYTWWENVSFSHPTHPNFSFNIKMS